MIKSNIFAFLLGGLSLFWFLYGMVRTIAWLVKKVGFSHALVNEDKPRKGIYKKIKFPLEKHFTPEKRNAAFIFFLTLLFNYLLFRIFAVYIWETFVADTRISVYLSQFEIYICNALLTAILSYILVRVISKRKKDLLIPSILYFLFYSALPYLVLWYPNDVWNGYISLGSKAGRLLFYFGVILPEIVGFIGLTFFRGKYKKLGWLFIVLMFLLGVEILPVRKHFLFFNALPTEEYYSEFKSYGKADRELEFTRAIETVENLVEKSKDSSSGSLDTVSLFVPIRVSVHDTCSLPNNNDKFKDYEKRTFLIDKNLDSDNDGLSDFEEAKLLSDAYSEDSDGDGVKDGDDSDPLNEYIVSDYARIKSEIFKFYGDTSSFFLVENLFYRGHGEIAHFDRKVIILNKEQMEKWETIWQNESGNYNDHYGIYIFGKYSFDIFKRVIIIQMTRRCGCGRDSDGYCFILVKWFGEWHVLGGRLLWT
jgi:hypothetical protein